MSASSARRGRVILLGGGPGDPDLVTVRGMNALREADAVVYDGLAPKELLDFVPPDAALHDVGKHGRAKAALPQLEITTLLVELAREIVLVDDLSERRVVRVRPVRQKGDAKAAHGNK